VRLLKGVKANSTTAVAEPEPVRVIWGDEALQLSGWPAGYDFDSAMRRTDSFGSFILRFVQVCGVNPHQRDLRTIADLAGWRIRSSALSAPLLATVAVADSRDLQGPPISIGPYVVGHAPRGLGDRLPGGAYAACLGMFGEIIGAKVFVPDERSPRF